jgi:glucokinase-like ROK family protein
MDPNLLKATHQQTRDHNQRLVLKTIFDRDGISRADVARLTGLTRTTVSQAVNELLEQKLVKEIGQGESRGGKTPILLSVARNARNLIGVDLGSNEFRGAVVNLRGETRHSISLPLDGRQGQDALQLAYDLIDALQVRVTSPLLGIGVGVPGVINPDKGSSVHWAVNLNWLNLPLRGLLEKRYEAPVYVANDSQVAALAESYFGKTHSANLVVISIGRGIGAGVVLDGRLWQGDGFGAGEIGHVTVVPDGPRCNCGHYGCLEAVASTGAIVQRAQAAARKNRKSLLNELKHQELTFSDVVKACELNDATTCALVRETGQYIGSAVANIVGLLNIKHIVIAGAVTRLGQPLLDEIRSTVRTHVLGVLADAAAIEFSQVGSEIVILGASALLLNYELGLNAVR